MTSYLDDEYVSSDNSDSIYDTPLIDAMIDNNYETFLELLKDREKNNINEITELGETCLQVAILQTCDMKYIKKLIEYEVDAEEGYLLSTSNIIYLKYFTELSDDIYNYICPTTQQSLLIAACMNGSLNTVLYVFDKTHLYEEVDYNNMNCFLATAMNKNSNNIFEIMGFLINKLNHLINTTDKNGNNFLQILENNINIEKNDKIKTIIFKFLIDKGLRLNHQNKQGKNILMTILENTMKKDWKYCYDYFLFFIKQGIDLSTKDENNMNILELCLEIVNTQIDLTSKSQFSIFKNNEFQYFRKIINLIIEYKNLENQEKKLLKNFKQKVTLNNLI
ncbi:hypothetical protein CPAV1605_1229 [seawater metagenome]|uniref:Ankyrin repeats (3 copies) n=1 Tax=seawater metagenome TaxID=1561972 RepID=A0A5E8CJF7_9ZZZZ